MNPQDTGPAACELTPRERQVYERRTFLDHLIRGAFWSAVAGTVFPLFSYFWPSASARAASSQQLMLPLDDVPPGGSKKLGFRGDTIIVVRASETEAYALSAVCTHLGCLVMWKKEDHHLVCPCHVARFQLNGSVEGGPAPSPLKTYKTKIFNGKIVVEA
jgi:cytochrome b6-f complex iron-sulfur subunit